MALTFKIGSLAIRTLAKPLANYIKHNAREHERFRQLCISFAQNLHRVDMRLRLGLLQDPAAIERQVARELADNAKRAKAAAAAVASGAGAGGGGGNSGSGSSAGAGVPTVKTEAEAKLEADKLKREKEKLQEKARKLPKVRPLSDAKAIETGANFISEAFLFCVAGGLIGLEYWRSRRKESNRRDDVAERLEELESENSALKAQVIRIEGVLEQEGVKLGGTSEWLTLAKRNLLRESKTTEEGGASVPEKLTKVPALPASNGIKSPAAKNTTAQREGGSPASPK